MLVGEFPNKVTFTQNYQNYTFMKTKYLAVRTSYFQIFFLLRITFFQIHDSVSLPKPQMETLIDGGLFWQDTSSLGSLQQKVWNMSCQYSPVCGPAQTQGVCPRLLIFAGSRFDNQKSLAGNEYIILVKFIPKWMHWIGS